jgi:hypothetical protein
MAAVLGVKADGGDEGSTSLAMEGNVIYENVEVKRVYYVIGANLSETFADAILAPGIPALGTLLYGARCSKIAPGASKQVIHPTSGVLTILYEVEVEFTTNIRAPTDDNPSVDWTSEIEKEHLEYDILTGAPIVTAAGEPLFTDRPVPYDIVTIRRLENYPWDPATNALYSGKVNSQPFYNYPIGTGMCTGIQVTEDTLNNARVCWASYQIKFRKLWNFQGVLQSDTWQAHLLNNGYYRRPGIGQVPVVNRDVTGNPVKCNLDLNGIKLADSMYVGTDLKIEGDLPPPPINVKVVRSAARPAVDADIGSILTVQSGTGFNPGSYRIIGRYIGVPDPAFSNGWFIGKLPSVGTNFSTGGVFTLSNSPTYVNFYRAYYVDFNALSLGPF